MEVDKCNENSLQEGVTEDETCSCCTNDNSTNNENESETNTLVLSRYSNTKNVNNDNSAEDQHSKFSCGEEAAAIKSIAVVKKSRVEFPVSFRELQSNTDIKTPPSNWLRAQTSIYFPNMTAKHSDFTSFIMGYQFPDCIGEVDIVSDAENIKKLLKMAYKPNTHLSMMVHRVGRTILIDEFDIYKYLLRQSQCQWKWLRKFFYEHILESLPRKQEENILVRPNKSRDVVQSKNLLSKFLYHSIEEEKEQVITSDPQQEDEPITVTTISSPTKETTSELPLEEHLPHPTLQPFTRNVIWNFEDLRMLIGTDLPIFGGTTHPCVSLRLKDMNKPINILTGIDYWLDNLMCNVPEVIMCYHQDGIVQKYELIKTEDLPHMLDCQFSPQLVRDIAHNILSFLKSKATKEGHTYWLFKGKDDDIVKLYDLTSLCNEKEIFETFNSSQGSENEPFNDGEDNPFTVPVAMLFYCVAKNMWNSEEVVSKHATIKALIENSLNLLCQEKYPKICCHAHYILSDINVPQHIDPDSPHFFENSEEVDMLGQNGDMEDDELSLQNEQKKESKKKKNTKKKDKKICNSIKVSSLCHPHESKANKQMNRDLPKFSISISERCDTAINHVITALHCLHLCPSERRSSATQNFNDNSSDSQKSEELDEPKMAKQFVPIPMPYAPLNQPDVEQLSSNIEEKPTDKNSFENPADESVVKKCLVIQESAVAAGTYFQGSEKSKKRKPFGRTDKNVIIQKTLLTGSILNSQLKDASWIEQMRFRLLRKATLVYMTKGRLKFNNKNYGRCLRYVKFSLHAWSGMASFLGPEVEFPLPCQPLLLAGDTYYNLSKDWERASIYIEQFNSLTEEEKEMSRILEEIYPVEDCNWAIDVPHDNVDALMLSYHSFESACSAVKSPPDIDLKRRLASICNELGCNFMNEADQLCSKAGGGVEPAGSLWKESRDFIDRAFDIFKEVNDNDNVALIHCNKGRFCRLYAYYSSSAAGEQLFTPKVKALYEEAFDEYEKALDIMKPKDAVHTDVAESVNWEYCSALFAYGTILQDNSSQENETEESWNKYIASIYDKALKFCDTKTLGIRQPLYQYRAAVIYIRLATMYHESFRKNKTEKNIKYLAELNYLRAAVLFLQLDSAPDIFKVHLDHVVLIEDSIQETNSNMVRWKSYLFILKLLTDCLQTFSAIQPIATKPIKKSDKVKCTEECKNSGRGKGRRKKNKESAKEDKKNEEEKTDEKLNEVASLEETENQQKMKSLLELFEKKLQSCLLAMMKMVKSSGKAMTAYDSDIKEMYSNSLNKNELPLEVHLFNALIAIKPILTRIFIK